jgi:hypothetical protein
MMITGLYVVKRDHPEENPGFIEGVFSTEGLAQTHAAKLRLAQLESGSTFYVEPLVADEYTRREVCHIAYISIHAFEGQTIYFHESEIGFGKAGLQEELPPAENLNSGAPNANPRYLLFREYGWTPLEARTRLIAHVREHLGKLGLIWQHIPDPKYNSASGTS